MSKAPTEFVTEKRILKIIMIIRGEKVIMDSDLADLYGVETRRLNEQVRRNIDKFPEDFVFQLTGAEYDDLKSQIATSSTGWGGRRKPPLVYTEYGALQAANVLKSEQAHKMSIFIVRAFVRLREMVLKNEVLSRKFDQLEKRLNDHDNILVELVREIRKLIDAPKPRGKMKDPVNNFRLYEDLAWLWPMWGAPEEYAAYCSHAARLIREHARIPVRSVMNAQYCASLFQHHSAAQYSTSIRPHRE